MNRSQPRQRWRPWLAVLVIGLAACGAEGIMGTPDGDPAGRKEGSIEATLAATTTALEVRIALLSGLGTDGLAVKSRISDGEVTLTGEVSHPRFLIIAGQVVSDLPGITAVHNQLSVAPAGTIAPRPEDARLKRELADELLAARVKLRLYLRIGLEAARVQVFTRGGSVTLVGALPTAELQTIAVTTAESTTGCVEVVDDISAP